jgi:cysteinyl-tRNA synthetase
MYSCIFGNWLDLHSGGIDLLFPHHENEEAQCCAYHDVKQWVGHWVHTGNFAYIYINDKIFQKLLKKLITNLVFFQGHLKLPNGGKMSKSLKNFITIKDFLQHHSADHFRMLCLISNYRNGNETNY